MLVCLKGEIELVSDTIYHRETIIIKQGQTYLHPKLEWLTIKFVETDSILLSFCSTEFDPEDYFGDYEVYKAYVNSLKVETTTNLHPDTTLSTELMPVPLLDLKANYASIKPKVDDAIHSVLDSAHYINGPAVSEFEKDFAKFVTSRYCVGLSSGTAALVIALKALDIGAGDEVILQGNAYIADALTIDDSGAKMVLVDHDESFQLDLSLVERAVTSKTKCILVVHMYGSCCDMNELMRICKKHNLKLIEDCAHAHGAEWKGCKLGSYGDVSCWSFYPGKNLGAYGDGGACTVNCPGLDKKIRLLKNYGSDRKYYNDIKGGLNERLDTIQAAVLNVKLPYLNEWNARRREIANMYKHKLINVGDITFPKINDGCLPVYHQFVLCTKRRDELLQWLNARKVDCIMHYPVPIHKQKAFSGDECALVGNRSSIPLSDSQCDVILSLPMCPMMTDAQVDHVVRCVVEFYSSVAISAGAVSSTADSSCNNVISNTDTDTGAGTDTATAAAHPRSKSPVKILHPKIRDIKAGDHVIIIEPSNLYQCTLGDDVFVGPFVEIQANSSIGARTRVQSHSFICELVTIGSDCFVVHGVMFVNDLMKGK